MTTGAKFINAQKISHNISDLIDTLEYEVRDEIAIEVANVIHTRAKATTKVVTGNLRKGWVAKLFKSKGPSQAFVAANYRISPHAHLVEFGTKFAKAQNILSRAVRTAKSSADSIAQRVLDKHIIRANK